MRASIIRDTSPEKVRWKNQAVKEPSLPWMMMIALLQSKKDRLPQVEESLQQAHPELDQPKDYFTDLILLVLNMLNPFLTSIL